MPLTGVIALDGPSGTGKSSVARTLAHRLGGRYLDTGAMYRAVTWAVLEEGIAVDDAEAVAACAAGCELEIGTDPDDAWVTVGGIQIDKVIRSAHVTAAVSPVSAVPQVRAILVAAQREIIGNGGIVVEGRDIGTVVAPDAELKVYLTASPEVRALRRARQEARTSPEDLTATAEAIRRRDEYDSTRPTSPLRPAEDAIRFDTSDLDEDQVVQRLVDMAISRGIVRTAADDGSGAAAQPPTWRAGGSGAAGEQASGRAGGSATPDESANAHRVGSGATDRPASGDAGGSDAAHERASRHAGGSAGGRSGDAAGRSDDVPGYSNDAPDRSDDTHGQYGDAGCRDEL